MGDISTWSPVDNSNTNAPPDGWPEGMAVSGVNNCARAMMGAIRRWYDTVPGSIAAAVANYLPLTGGTLSGPLQVPYLHSTGSMLADLDVGCRNLNSSGTVTAVNTTATGTAQAAQLTSTGNINAAAGSVTANYVHSTGSMLADLDVGCRNLNSSGTVTGTSFIGNVSVPANGPISTGGTITGGQITSTGDITTALGTFIGYGLSISNNCSIQAPAVFTSSINVSGTCYNADGIWHLVSDVRMKDTILPYSSGLEAILALDPVSYIYRDGTPFADAKKTRRLGLVAQDVELVLPELVGTATFAGEEMLTLAPGNLVYVLVNSCKELAAQNAVLAARITALEGIQ